MSTSNNDLKSFAERLREKGERDKARGFKIQFDSYINSFNDHKLEINYLKNEDFLFSSLWKASKEELRGNLAVFIAQTSITNRMVEQYEQAKIGFLKIASRFFNSVSAPTKEDEQAAANHMLTEIEENEKYLIGYSKDDLFKIITGKIARHISLRGMSEGMTTKTLSTYFLDYMATSYKNIDKITSPRAKADAIVTQISAETEKQLGELLKKMHESKDRDKILALLKVKDISGVSEEQRRELQRQIATGDIDTKSLLKLSAGVGTVGLMSSAGFGLYMGAASIIKGIGLLTVGTVPFGVYAGAMSTLSVVTGPIGMIAVLGITGVMMFRDTYKANARAMGNILMLARQYHGVLFNAAEEYDTFARWHKHYGTNEDVRNEIIRFEQYLNNELITPDEMEIKLGELKRKVEQDAALRHNKEIQMKISFYEHKIHVMRAEYEQKLSENDDTIRILEKKNAELEQRIKESLAREEENKKQRDAEIQFLQKSESTKDTVRSVGSTAQTRIELITYFDKAKKEIDILSPWIGNWFHSGDPLYRAIDRAIRRGIIVKIAFGMYDENAKDQLSPSAIRSKKRERTSIENARRLCAYYRQYRNFIIARTYSHNKIILIDNDYYMKTSVNILSNQDNTVDEDTIVVTSDYMVSEDRKIYFGFTTIPYNFSERYLIDK